MSPEHRRLSQVPTDIRQIVDAELGRLSWDPARAINTGFAFKISGTNGARTIELRALEELTPGQRADAKKDSSPWHVVLPLEHSSKDKPHLSAKFTPIESDQFTMIPTKAGQSHRRWHRTRIR